MCPPPPRRAPHMAAEGPSLRSALRAFLVALALLLAWAQYGPTLAAQSRLDELRPSAQREAAIGSSEPHGSS